MMNYIAAEERLKVISGLIQEWGKRGKIGQLEYDLLLDKIKGLYEQVKFSDATTTCVGEGSESNATFGSEASLPIGDVAVQKHARADIAGDGSAYESALHALYEVDGKAESVSEVCAFTVTTPVETTISAMEPALCSTEQVAAASEATPQPACCREQHNAISDLYERGETPKVLGDVIGTVGQTIGDRLKVPTVDIASKIGHERVASIRHAIGLNDRYLLVRDLFDGDIDAFETALMRIDSFTSMEGAMLYIHDNFNWTSESDAARLISDLLVRKLM